MYHVFAYLLPCFAHWTEEWGEDAGARWQSAPIPAPADLSSWRLEPSVNTGVSRLPTHRYAAALWQNHHLFIQCREWPAFRQTCRLHRDGGATTELRPGPSIATSHACYCSARSRQSPAMLYAVDSRSSTLQAFSFQVRCSANCATHDLHLSTTEPHHTPQRQCKRLGAATNGPTCGRHWSTCSNRTPRLFLAVRCDLSTPPHNAIALPTSWLAPAVMHPIAGYWGLS